MKNDTVTMIPNSISPYLNEIAERLWSGHAAIMVGAGFSKNASPNGTSTRGFPDWQQLGDLFYEKINGTKPDNKGKYLNVLKLADEVQAAFGRPALDQSLRDVIPDYEYEPSPLHVKLLDLPWTDVFTTNYDTLLERACISVSSQKYDVVINKEDLVYSEKPRIIKLHGSFPSERPFIITEEDYRRYPKDFAPFVNTVQQSLLENTLCLIGFSGDDPNFLQWIGWIRDNLGSENSPKIYLIGVLNLSSAQKKLLEQRNIVLIDMAVCSNIDGSHYKGLKIFLDYLLSRKKEDNRLDWPENSELSQSVPQKEKLIQIEGIVQIWRKQRLTYPGWVSVPEDRRSFLWANTRNWIEFITSEDKLPGCLDLEFVYELNWRLEKCLLPLLSIQQAEFIEIILKKYWTQSEIINLNELRDHVPPSSNINSIETDKNTMGKMCIPLMLSLMRFYRTEGLQEKWKEINRKIADSNLSKYLTAEHKASLYYERSLFALFRLDILELKQKIEEWPSNESLPFFEAKRAALLAEIGEVNTAEFILEKSLKNVRALLNLKPITTDYSLVSQEAIIMLLLQYVQLPKSFGNADQNKFSERWNVLKQYKCDPWNELKLFASALERAPIIKPSVTIKQEFDIGRTTPTNHFVNEDSEALIAYRFLIFCEDIGLPFRIPNVDIGKKSAEGTLLRISQYSPFWSMVTLVRIGDQKTVDYIFNREYLAKIDEIAIDELITEYVEILNKVQDERQISNFSAVLAKVIPEILSRLCCKCSTKSKDKLIKLLLRIYESDHKRIYSGIQNLTKRLMNSFTIQQRLNLIPMLLDFPLPASLSPRDEFEFAHPFQFLDIDTEDIKTWDKPII
ncbi:MAG: SIR2 family protein, partial [Nitrosomonas sp.]|nr:SIR2 family protein [Nitrosomonas sp.]